MKLARIEHERCSEYDCTTYAWVPDDWTEEQFEDAVGRAEKAYLAAYAKWRQDKENEPENLWPSWGDQEKFYAAHPGLTVACVAKLWDEALAKRSAWEKEYDKGKKRFSNFLVAEGAISFYDYEPDLTAHIYWGHRHGDSLDYDDDSGCLYQRDLSVGKGEND